MPSSSQPAIGDILDVLYLFKIVSLASMGSSIVAAAYIFLTGSHPSLAAAAGFFAVLVILRHRSNIQRRENKIRWM